MKVNTKIKLRTPGAGPNFPVASDKINEILLSLDVASSKIVPTKAVLQRMTVSTLHWSDLTCFWIFKYNVSY